jgi:valyl-tRNA synthetase
MQLEKVYEPQRFEPHWAQWWIESGIYRADANEARDRRVFSIVIPPPNVTGSLHIGHMFEHTMMDVAVRWHRMRGDLTLWLPGTDHAGIATQMVVERQLRSEGVTRQQLGRTEFERRVWQWKEEYGGRIVAQIRREGASVDWSRERFTMDPGLSRAVRETFVRLWEKGLIYRGEYMVNWCPGCQTAISDLETVHEEVDGHLWHIRYPVVGRDESVVVATTRPETMLGDTAVVVHPEDDRYKHLHGERVLLPLANREIPIVADALADPKFGTGVVKITPAHDPNDFEAARRHGLPLIKVIGEDARMTVSAGRFAGLDRFEARKRVIAALEEAGVLVKVEPYRVSIAKCERCKTIIEPLISVQWFAHMKPLAEKAAEAVRDGRMRFVPNDREALFFHWMGNIRDWCISRQLWWGHRIPAWHCSKCGQITVARETPAFCSHCQSTEIEQDRDVLDTWFSSQLWPFSTLGWPDDTEDLRTFYPTSLMITGFDILFFWVSRMMMIGMEMTGQVPFREIHIHGLVRDADKQKMSKTKGNVIDPLVVMDRYGTDAVREALVNSAAAGADIALKEDRMEAGSAFANKIWNASRLLFMNMERSELNSWTPRAFPTGCIEDAWIIGRLNATIKAANAALAQHRYHEFAQELRHFIWDDFCDWYLEVKKSRFIEGSGQDEHWTAVITVYETMLRLLHPLMPFLTEELWQRLMQVLQAPHVRSISLAEYPKEIATAIVDDTPFRLVQEVITNARKQRADRKLEPKTLAKAVLSLKDQTFSRDDLGIIGKLANLQLEQSSSNELPHRFELKIETGAAESAAARQRAKKEKAEIEKAIQGHLRQLQDPVFLSKAPAHVVAEKRAKIAGYEAQLAQYEKVLAEA